MVHLCLFPHDNTSLLRLPPSLSVLSLLVVWYLIWFLLCSIPPYHCRISLVVTEIVDAGLLGERIIPTLRHAWRELLLPKQPDLTVSTNQIQPSIGGRVIPCGATVYAMVIECPEIRRQSRWVYVQVVVCVGGFRILGSMQCGIVHVYVLRSSGRIISISHTAY